MTLNHRISPSNCSVVPGLRGIHLNDTNLRIGIWALNLEHVMFFLYGQDFREPPKRENHQHTPSLHLFTTHLAHCNILSLEWPYRNRRAKGNSCKDESGWGVNKTIGRQPGAAVPRLNRNKTNSFTVNCSCYMESITRSLWELGKGGGFQLFSEPMDHPNTPTAKET